MAAKKKKTTKKVAKKKPQRGKAVRRSKAGRPKGGGFNWVNERNISLVATMIARGFHKGTIKDAVHALAPDQNRPPIPTYERLMREARALLADQAAVDRDQERARSLERYYDVIRNPKSRDADRIRAQRELDKILGLDYATFSGEGQTIHVELKGEVNIDPKEELRRLLERHRDVRPKESDSES